MAKPAAPGTEEISTTPEMPDQNTPPQEAAEHPEHHEANSSGDFREPHAEAPADFASHETEPVEKPVTEPAAEISLAPETRSQREFPRDRRPARRPEPPRQRQWVKPADFRPAETSAISEAVAHATEIAESLKQMIDQLDEVLELVEVAERQKLADEREIDELRRALRRIQPPRRELLPPRREPLPSRPPRRDEPRHSQPVQQHEEAPTPEEPPPHAD
jgi:hypothetical protein